MDAVPSVVGLYILSAYWFTASTSFANPAVTVARSLTDTFSGIEPAGVGPFVCTQVIGGLAATVLNGLFAERLDEPTNDRFGFPTLGASAALRQLSL
jgi:glycerol uptake facilitator-like aquaporin